MKILIISDIHAQFDNFPIMEMPDAELCLVAGDITNIGVKDNFRFKQSVVWMRELARKYQVLWIPGNHDLGFVEGFDPYNNSNPFPDFPLNTCHRIDGTSIERWIKGDEISVAGVNMSPCYDLPYLKYLWFNMTYDIREEYGAYSSLGSYKDIIVSHAPPYGILDLAGDCHIGSRALLSYIDEYNPCLVVCGHCHEARGYVRYKNTEIYNTACSWQVIDYPI